VTRGEEIFLALLLVPVPLVLLVAILRGYAITVVMHRDREERR
jgi:hypothetical protein